MGSPCEPRPPTPEGGRPSKSVCSLRICTPAFHSAEYPLSARCNPRAGGTMRWLIARLPRRNRRERRGGRHVRVQGSGGRRGDDGGADRADDRRRRVPGRAQGHLRGARAGRPRRGPQRDRGAGRQARGARQAHRRAGRRADRRDRGPHRGRHLLRGLRRRGFRDRGRPRADGDQAGGVRRAGRLHARPRDPRLQHLLAVDHRDRRSDAAPRQGGGLPLLLPRLGAAVDRGDRRG